MRNRHLGLRLTAEEEKILSDLAQQTGRDKSNLTRALIRLAGADPLTRRRLGDLPQPTTTTKPQEQAV